MIRVFYFGCYRERGHYLWDSLGRQLYGTGHPDFPKDFPVSIPTLDGGLIPPQVLQKQGEAYLSHTNGWTLISFEDRSIDTRPQSHSVFIVEGEESFEDALLYAQKAFPKIFARFNFKVVLASFQKRQQI